MTPGISEQLPHLLSLLDDPSAVVRSEVRTALTEFGYFLRPASRDWIADRSSEMREEWDFICRMAESRALEQTWLSWMLLEKQADQIEAGMMALELGGSYSGSFIHDSIEDLVREFTALHPDQRGLDELFHYLYDLKAFDKTLRQQNYLQHRLGYILRYRRGSQLGLGILTMILAERIGISLSLVKLHGNWLLLHRTEEGLCMYNPEQRCARLLRSEEMYLEEAYRRGLLITEDLSAGTAEIMEEIIESHIAGYKRSGLHVRETEMSEKLLSLKHEKERRELLSFLTA